MGAGKVTATLILACALLSACSGPAPQVAGAAPVGASSVDVDCFLKNRANGEGDIDLTAWLEGKSGGARYEGRETVHLEAHEEVHVVVRVHAPPGEYKAGARATYPP